MTTKKVKALVKYTRRKWKYHLSQDHIHLIIELAQNHPKWSIARVFEEAARPKIRTGVVFYPTPKIAEALKDAAKRYDVSIPFVLNELLLEWHDAYEARTKA